MIIGHVILLSRLRARFRRQHLLEWISQLRDKVIENERVGYYSTALRIAEAVLQDDEASDEAAEGVAAQPADVAMKMSFRFAIL